MHTNSGFTMMNVMGEIRRKVVEAVADRPEDTSASRFVRQAATVLTLTAFLPRDPVEAMLAGHCVVFDNLLLDSARDILHGQPIEMKLRTRNQSLAFGKQFLAQIEKFEQRQSRLTDQPAIRAPVEKAASMSFGPGAPGEAPTATETDRPQAGAAPDGRSTPEVRPETPPLVAAVPPAIENAAMDEARAEGPATENAAPSEPTRAVHPDDSGEATTVALPVSHDRVVAPAAGHAPSCAPRGGADHASPGPVPDQPKPGNQKTSPAEADRAWTGLPQVQPQGDVQPRNTLAMLAASPGVAPSAGLAGQISQAGQPTNAVRGERVEELA